MEWRRNAETQTPSLSHSRKANSTRHWGSPTLPRRRNHNPWPRRSRPPWPLEAGCCTTCIHEGHTITILRNETLRTALAASDTLEWPQNQSELHFPVVILIQHARSIGIGRNVTTWPSMSTSLCQCRGHRRPSAFANVSAGKPPVTEALFTRSVSKRMSVPDTVWCSLPANSMRPDIELLPSFISRSPLMRKVSPSCRFNECSRLVRR